MQGDYKTFKIPDWLMADKGLVVNYVTGLIIDERPQAVLIQTRKGKTMWLPKSVIKEDKVTEGQTSLF